MSATYIEEVTHVFDSIVDTMGVRHRLDKILTRDSARLAQVYPRHSVLYLSPPDSDIECHTAITVKDEHLMDILTGKVRIHVTVPDPLATKQY
jgi:hypothetical protein